MKVCSVVARILIAGLQIGFSATVAAQRAYPNKPIHFITPYAPGGSTTSVAHLIGQKLTESWGQQVLVENRPGGSTIIGSEALVKSAPDGYTIMMVSVDHTIIPQLLRTTYDAVKDFSPIATLAASPLMIAIHPSVPANNLQEFIALAKLKPGQLNYAQVGNGTISHLMGEMFNVMAGVKIQDIAYKGGGPATIAVLAGQVQATFTTPINLVAHITNGKLRGLAIAGDNRLSALPQVPTSAEAGLPGFDVRFWLGIVAPAGIPKDIVGRLSSEIMRTLATPEFREKLVSQGMEPYINTPEQFGALIDAERAKYAKVIKAANIRIDQ